MIERTLFSSIEGLPVRLVRPDKDNPKQRKHWERGHILIKRGKRVIGFVMQDDLFDGDGNYIDFNS